MHYAEGSLLNWLVMKLVFMTIPTQPMPFFVRPIARQLCATVAATQPPSLLTMYDLTYLSAVETSCCGDGAAGPACLASSLAVFAQQPVGVPTTLSECHVACLRDGNPLLGCDLLCGVQPQARW